MTSLGLRTYRSIVREVNRAAIVPRATRNPIVLSTFHKLFKLNKEDSGFEQDMQNAVVFMRSQRMHKTLVDRYNPLHDLTAEERIKATARRVGLDMPIESKGE
ncbi:hypothetical protein PHLGIDRAFT_113459 [Phlebiopsis gigantea 11061_1 CR5-6]|uniref:Uncharacterized protein n=1 Tax=Phlebiopsis gigantea (strain 11061_1 CR5-6) TaxID=745531 RepID=A0A0C3SEM8_PHLG1|nr:hypothetical protein PHLGIDRAFT_113459 [Phlebiopsis gigantea 11061_1 CR5-6]